MTTKVMLTVKMLISPLPSAPKNLAVINTTNSEIALVDAFTENVLNIFLSTLRSFASLPAGAAGKTIKY